jgi:hypothetical protein
MAANTKVTPAGISGSGVVTWQSVQTTNFTASAGKAYPVNTTSAGITVTLPSTAVVGDQISVVDYAGTAATNNITLNPNGLNINGTTSSALIATKREAVTLTYIDSTQGWLLSSDAQITLSQPYSVQFLVVAGGGGAHAGGGGAGGYRTSTQTVTVGTAITITVGDGGAGTSSGTKGNNGSNSSISGSGLTTITSAGGGGGASLGTVSLGTGANGGSGGGGSRYAGNQPGGSGNTPSTSPSQGNNGGSGSEPGPNYGSGGGGGAGAVGGNGSGTTGGNGGNGTASSITGSSVTYAGGGGAGTNNGGTAGTGGTGGGGNGNGTNNGTANTGGGGGGNEPGTGGNGGKGVVILSLPTANYSGTSTGSPTITTSGSNTILQFNGSGSYTA